MNQTSDVTAQLIISEKKLIFTDIAGTKILQEKFDTLTTTAKLLGYSNSEHFAVSTMWEKITCGFNSNGKVIRIQFKCYCYRVWEITFELRENNKLIYQCTFSKGDNLDSLSQVLNTTIQFL